MAGQDLPWIAENDASTATSGTPLDGLARFDGPVGEPLGDLAWDSP